MAAAALEQSVLESKDKDTLLEMAKALGVKANSRLKKADIIDKILDTTSVATPESNSDDGPNDGSNNGPNTAAVNGAGANGPLSSDASASSAGSTSRAGSTSPDDSPGDGGP